MADKSAIPAAAPQAPYSFQYQKRGENITEVVPLVQKVTDPEPVQPVESPPEVKSIPSAPKPISIPEPISTPEALPKQEAVLTSCKFLTIASVKALDVL